MKVELYDVPSKYDWEESGPMYKQLHSTSEASVQQKLSPTTPDSSSILCYLQAVFILLIAGHKSLSNDLAKIAKSNQFHKPVLSSLHTSQTVPSPTNSSSYSTVPTCSCTGPPSTCGGCQPSGYACEKSRYMCMMVEMMF